MPDNLLIDAIRNDDLILVKELIDKHHCVDSPLFEEMTPLHYAIRLGRVEMAVALIRAKAKLEECYHDMTPLLLATISGQEEIVDCLIEAKANVNSRDKSSTCLENAVTQSYPSIAAKLIMAGANRSVNFKCLKTMNDLEFVRSLLPDSLLFNIPLKEIVKDKIVHFNEPGTTESYVNTSNPAAYLIENNLC